MTDTSPAAPAAESAAPTARPPYLLAGGVTLLALVALAGSLAPSVTWWDAGEFIASMKVLGIPHPPGTPLFVLMGHVWAGLLPFIGEYAARTNLLSAVFGAAAMGCWFLVAQETLRPAAAGLSRGAGRLVRYGGAAAAALAAGFTFTSWQNSNETEVYAVAQFAIAAICWLCLRWRVRRGDAHAPRYLLLAAYLGGLSIANHLLALLVGPAVAVFLAVTLLGDPAADPARRRTEWGQAVVIAGLWVLLIGTGLGSRPLILLGLVCFVAAAIVAARAGALGFALAALVIAAIGATPYLYLYIRSGQHPLINEAAPATWNALVDVVRRAQYPPRTPFDDPTVYHGPDNPGRTLALLGVQLQGYLLYFDWQWANGLTARLGDAVSGFPLRTIVTLLFVWLGVQGSAAQRRDDRGGWWLLLTLFLVTGLGLVVYMNFKPGYSLGYDRWPDPNDHEVRERDYFYVMSFVVWGLWAGLGLADLARRLLDPRGQTGSVRAARPLAAAVLALALLPLALNWRAATRRQGADARLPGDVAYDLLNTVPPYGILFTYGDNDTFPLWWAQEVAGIRRDVTVVCLALANTDWYLRQLRTLPIRDFDEAAAPPVWRGLHPVKPTGPLHSMSDDEIARSMYLQQVPQALDVPIGPVTAHLRAGTVLAPNDVASLRILQQNAGRRPVVWALTAGRDFAGLGAYVVQQGLGFRLELAPVDTTRASLDFKRVLGAPLDVPLTERLMFDTYRYGALPGSDLSRLEPTSRGFASSLAVPFTQLAFAYEQRGDAARMERALDAAAGLSSNPAIRAARDSLRFLHGTGR